VPSTSVRQSRSLRSLTRADRAHFDGSGPAKKPRWEQVGPDGWETDDEIDIGATLEQAALAEGAKLLSIV